MASLIFGLASLFILICGFCGWLRINEYGFALIVALALISFLLAFRTSRFKKPAFLVSGCVLLLCIGLVARLPYMKAESKRRADEARAAAQEQIQQRMAEFTTPAKADVMDPQAVSRAIWEASKILPPFDGFTSVSSAGGMTELSSWRNFVIDLQGKTFDEVVEKYLALYNKNLVEAGLSTSGAPTIKLPHWAGIIAIRGQDGKDRGTITIVAKPVTDTQFIIIIVAAVSP